jgi:predicted MPP superfamily phosphohydrolase
LKKPVGTDLILTGHTHGGQIRLPLIGSLAPIPTNLGRAYDMGLFNISGGQMFISRGIGESGTRARLFCRPEISILNVNF